MRYIALLRGINVGGNNPIKMSELKLSLERDGFKDVRTYINSGNILFSSDDKDAVKLASKLTKHIADEYGHAVPAVVFDQPTIRKIVTQVPKGWGTDSLWRYYTLFLIPPYDMKELVASIGELKPGIETLTIGAGALYQSMELKSYGRTTTSKLPGTPAYKKMTMRNWNTTRKLLELMEDTK